VSYKLVDLCMDIPSLTSAEWSVLVALCRYASNDDHTCFPSLEVAATVAHLTLRTVQRTIPSLVERKLLTILEKANGRGNRNKFKINATLLRELRSKDDTTSPFIEGDKEESTEIKGDIVTPIVEQGERVTLTPSKGDIVTPQRVPPCRIKGDIDASYIGRICHESVSSESVSESVALALTSHEVHAGVFELAERDLIQKKITDPRNKPFREALREYYGQSAKMAMTWDGSEGKHFSEFLAANPLLTLADFETILNHRARSEVTHSERPRKWLPNATSYLNGPLDRYNKPLGGNSNAKPNRWDGIVDSSRAALAILDGVDNGANRNVRSLDSGGTTGSIFESADDSLVAQNSRRDR
jgi:hypothetical protein